MMATNGPPLRRFQRVRLSAGPAAGFPAASRPSRPWQTDIRLSPDELERRLIELGFTEGSHVEILHEGAFGRDPIAVRVNTSTVALRRPRGHGDPGDLTG